MARAIRENAGHANVLIPGPISQSKQEKGVGRFSDTRRPAIRIMYVAFCVYVSTASTLESIARGDEPKVAIVELGLNDSGRTSDSAPKYGFVDAAAGMPHVLANQQVFGDADGDGDVDLLDYSVFIDYLLGASGSQQQAGWQSYDSDADGDVDLRDFARWQNAFTGDAPVLGACCDHSPFGACTDGLTRAACDCSTCEWVKLSTCSELECPHTAIPTVGEWGLVVLTLLLLTGAKLAFRRSNRPDPLRP